MRAYGQGDAQAFEALYARHKGASYRYFLRHAGGDTATADELHQDLWLRVIGARERYEAQAKFSTWLFTIANNRAMNHLRSRGRNPLPGSGLGADDGLRSVDERASTS